MNNKKLKGFLTVGLGLLLLNPAMSKAQEKTLQGAWEIEGNPQKVAVLVDGYLSLSTFTEEPAEFINTTGGPYSYDGKTLTVKLEFDAQNPQQVGKEYSVSVRQQGDELTVTYEDGASEQWKRTDPANDKLAGVWRITQRQSNGEMHEIPLAARRTLKVLSGKRFQWIAINVETGEFSGTGGGTYSFENGVYTEQIEFFSRDNSRVGMALDFKGELKDGEWHHSGKSSKGAPIYEIWSRFKQ